MANKSLQGEMYSLPSGIIEKLKEAIAKHGENQRASNLINAGKISYENAKRIKNFLENTDKSSAEYELAGGDAMLHELNRILKTKRHDEHRSKDIMSKLAGQSNTHKKTHDRDSGKVSKPIAVPKLTENYRFIIKESTIKIIQENYGKLVKKTPTHMVRERKPSDIVHNLNVFLDYFLGYYKTSLFSYIDSEKFNLTEIFNILIKKLENSYKKYDYEGYSEGYIKELLIDMPISYRINLFFFMDDDINFDDINFKQLVKKFNTLEKEMYNLGLEYKNKEKDKRVETIIRNKVDGEIDGIKHIKKGIFKTNADFLDDEKKKELFDVVDLLFKKYLNLFERFLLLSFSAGKHKS